MSRCQECLVTDRLCGAAWAAGEIEADRGTTLWLSYRAIVQDIKTFLRG